MEFATLDVERDSEEIEDLVRQSIRTSYALRADQIDDIIEEEFKKGVLSAKVERDDLILLVARQDGDVKGFAEGTIDDDSAEVRWLHVDPETRDDSLGTELFERLTTTFVERDVGAVRKSTFVEGGSEFSEQFGFVHVDDVEFGVGSESISAEIYATPDAVDAEQAAAFDPLNVGEEPPAWVETQAGLEVYIDPQNSLSGSIGPFFDAYVDAEFTDRYGYYCGGCKTVTTAADRRERVICPECGNHHRLTD